MVFRLTAISTILFLIAQGILSAQPNKNGVPIVTNYDHSITKGSEQNWCVTQDHRGVIYVGNNNKGILEYDGVEWRRIPVPKNPIIRSLVTGEDGVVYVGSVSEFGYLAADRSGSMKYRSLSEDIDQEKYPFGGIWRTYYHQGEVYFCGFHWIFVYNLADEILTPIETPENTYFSFLIDHTIYLSAYGSGLMRYENGAFVKVPGGEFFKDKDVSGLVQFDESRLLAGTLEHGLFLFDTQTRTIEEGFMGRELTDYLKQEAISSIQAMDSDFAISQLNNGVVILNKSGKATEIITESEELIDEDATYAYYNKHLESTNPLWITNFMGISKLETANPFRVFSESSGFEDFVTDIKFYNSTLFISTFNGLYYKSSSPTGTQFKPVTGTEGEQIRNLMVFSPSRNSKFLIASSDETTFIIDSRMRVSILKDLIRNPPADLGDQSEYSGHFVVQDPEDPEVIYTGWSQIIGLRYHRGLWSEVSRIKGFREEVLNNKVIDKYGYLWVSANNFIVKIDIHQKNDPIKKFLASENGLPSDENNRVFLDPDSEEVLIGTMDGFYGYDYFHDAVYRDTVHNQILPPGNNQILTFYQDHDKEYWYSFENESAGWCELVARAGDSGLQVVHDHVFQRLANTSTDVFYSHEASEVWFGKSDKLYHFNKFYTRNDSLPYYTLLRRITLNTDSLIFSGTHFKEDAQGRLIPSLEQPNDPLPEIKYIYNDLSFWWAAPFFEQEEELRYSFKLEGFGEGWSAWEKTTFKEFTNLPHGSYTFRVKAQNIYGNVSLPASYSFTILRPWYAHFLAYVIYLVLGGIFVYILIKLYTRRLKQENLRLEKIIEDRTAEIRKQKEELTDSIQYASRIQRALLPPTKVLEENQMEHFILFRPRDIVSGDFYWMGFKKDRLLVVAADCTGHGVPGAFMSMLGMTFLDEIIIQSELTNTGEILDQLREHVITSLRQSGDINKDSTKDGMDLSILSIDISKGEFQFSGAYNPIYLVRKLKRNEMAKLKKGEPLDLPRGYVHSDTHLLMHMRADQMPIGISEKSLPFTTNTIKDEGYTIYMFSDGFLDQFGGPRGKKFMSKNFKKLILELQSVALKDQGSTMEKILRNWMGGISQIDDILVMGLRLNDQ